MIMIDFVEVLSLNLSVSFDYINSNCNTYHEANIYTNNNTKIYSTNTNDNSSHITI